MGDLERRLHDVDRVDVPDLWSEIEHGSPRRSPVRPGRSRLAAAVVALALAAASSVFAIRTFGGDGSGRVAGPIPDPSTVCTTDSVADASFVSLAGVEFSQDLLEGPGVSLLELPQPSREALESFERNPEFELTEAPRDGWRILTSSSSEIVIGAPTSGDEWYYASFANDGTGWTLRGWGATRPTVTDALRGQGLHLEWRGPLSIAPGGWTGGIWLVNDRDTTWNDDRGEYWAIPHVYDPDTGREIGPSEHAIAGVGREYSVPPGHAVKLPVAISPRDYAPGAYAIIACVPELALASPVGELVVEPGGSERPTTYTDPAAGWSIEIPDGFTAQPFSTDGGRATTEGVAIANFPIERPESLESFRAFPAGGAVLRIWRNEGGPVGPVVDDDASFPLSAASFHAIDPYVGDAEPTPRYRSFNADGATYAIALWLGPEIDERSAGQLGEAVATLRFPPTEPMSLVDRRLIVLGPEAPPTGTAIRYDRADLPIDPELADYRGDFTFYLVGGSARPYAVTTDFLGNGARCDLRFDPDTVSFSCPEQGWAWDRYGRPTRRGRPFADGVSDLLILPVVRSWDGNLMVDPFGNLPEAAVDAWS